MDICKCVKAVMHYKELADQKKKKSYPGFGMTSIDISSNISIYNWEDIL